MFDVKYWELMYVLAVTSVSYCVQDIIEFAAD